MMLDCLKQQRQFSQTPTLASIRFLFPSHSEETPEVLVIAYWGYRCIKDVPESLFDKMLRYPGTKALLTALIGLANRSDNPHEKWEFYQRIIDEFTFEDIPEKSWYWLTHRDMLRLAEGL